MIIIVLAHLTHNNSSLHRPSTRRDESKFSLSPPLTKRAWFVRYLYRTISKTRFNQMRWRARRAIDSAQGHPNLHTNNKSPSCDLFAIMDSPFRQMSRLLLPCWHTVADLCLIILTNPLLPFVFSQVLSHSLFVVDFSTRIQIKPQQDAIPLLLPQPSSHPRGQDPN